MNKSYHFRTHQWKRAMCPHGDVVIPLIGLSLVLLNSVTGTLEKPALKSRLLTPVTLSVCLPLHPTWTREKAGFNH